MRTTQVLADAGLPFAMPGVYECPWRDDSGHRVFVAIGRNGEGIGRSAGNRPSPQLMQRARRLLSREGSLMAVRKNAPATPLLPRGVHLAPWRFHGEEIYVAVDADGVCRAEAVGSDYQCSAYLWSALGDPQAERERRRLARADDRRFRALYRSGHLEAWIRRQVGDWRNRVKRARVARLTRVR